MSPVTLQSSPPLQANQPSSSDRPEKIRDSASQFEGLLIAQMLKSAREASPGALGEDDHSNDSIMDMAEQQISGLLASSGGLGLSRLIMQGLSTPKKAEI
jgi:Rod binding domain-containing protein